MDEIDDSQVEKFRDWLVGDGWEIDPNNGQYQILRARKGKRFIVVYYNTRGPWRRVVDTGGSIVDEFRKSKHPKKPVIDTVVLDLNGEDSVIRPATNEDFFPLPF